jgi:uncharacterized ParB-like nuclease family protein
LTATRRTHPSVNSGIIRCPETGVKRMGIEGGSTAPPLVATVTVDGEARYWQGTRSKAHDTSRRAARRCKPRKRFRCSPARVSTAIGIEPFDQP